MRLRYYGASKNAAVGGQGLRFLNLTVPRVDILREIVSRLNFFNILLWLLQTGGVFFGEDLSFFSDLWWTTLLRPT